MILIPEAFRDLVEGTKNDYLYYGGRVGGKSKNTAIIAVLLMLQNPYHDVIVARASYGSLGDSSYEEFDQALQEMGEDIYNLFVFKKSPLRIERKDGTGKIYFIGYGGSNMSRTKSIKPKHKLICVICEETQELREERNLDEALASFRRNYGEGIRTIILGNPQPQSAHWFSQYILKKQKDKDWIVRRVTYLDILDFVNDFDLREIIKTKIQNEPFYNWFYLGDSSSGIGSVYPMFRPEKHIITNLQFERAREKYGIKVCGLVIGGDGAVNRDCTAFVPMLLLNNGQAVIAPIFYHDPKESGQMGYHQLVQDHVSRWLEEILRRYNLISCREYREHPYSNPLPVFMRIDSAAPDLIQECRFFFGDRVDVKAIKKGSIQEMVGVLQSAISNDNIIVIDYGGYYDYVRNRWIIKDKNILAEQLEALVWNDKQTGYDPIVPNDVSDALTYGNLFWYGNQENIQFFNRLKAGAIPNLLLNDIINKD